eukprot:8492495-Alexandrium_andersonii.AAC.1
MPDLRMRQAGGRAGGASRGGSGGRSPPGKTYDYSTRLTLLEGRSATIERIGLTFCRRQDP